MTRKLILASAIATALTGHPALALELGALRTDSALNQPFVGEIDLADIGPDELDALRVAIASPAAFEKAGIERYYSLTQLRFTPEVTNDGRLLVRVSSQNPIREPYLDFLVEAVWPTGRLVKGYTVLLDPPAQTERRAPNVQAARVDSVASGSERGLLPVAGDSDGYIPAPGEGFPLYIGPVGGGEGLWSLARRYAAAGATDAQTAMALYRCNQGAFVRGDINRLIAGKTLVIPSRAELFALDADEARRELQAAMHGHDARRSPLTGVTPEMLSRLRLVGATPGTGTPTASLPQPGAAPSPGAGGMQSPDVLLAIETSETARQETIELRNRIRELETRLADIQALLQVRNAELARAQSIEPSPIVDSAPEADLDEPGSESGLIPEPELASEPTVTPQVRLSPAEEGVLESVPVEPPPIAVGPLPEIPGPAPEPDSELESMPEPTEPDAAIGLIPIPTPQPVEPEASTDVAPEPPAPKPVAESAVDSTPEPAPELQSTWHALLLPLAALAGVTALGILLFSLLTARRRRQEQEANAEDDRESDLVLNAYQRPTQLEPDSVSDEADSAPVAAPLANLSLSKPEQSQPTLRTPASSSHRPSASATPDIEATSEEVLSGLTDLDTETEEADVLSEADIYIAYGRHKEARDLLNKELKRYPHRLDVKYKLAEALAASGETEALIGLLNDIRAAGGETEQPAQWEQLQRRLRDLAPAILAAAGAGLGMAGVAAETLESVSMPELESSVDPHLDSENERLFDLGAPEDSTPLALDASEDAFTPFGDVLTLELDAEPPIPAAAEIAQAIAQDIDSILPLSTDSEGLDLDVGDFAATPVSIEPLPVAFEPQSNDGILDLDLDLEMPGLDRTLEDPDLAIDDVSTDESQAWTPSPAPAGEPADDESLEPQDSGPAPEAESLPSDLLSSHWQLDSGIWDETATKLDLARAYIEMDDKEAAREILEEVMSEGREEQRSEARTMLERLG